MQEKTLPRRARKQFAWCIKHGNQSRVMRPGEPECPQCGHLGVVVAQDIQVALDRISALPVLTAMNRLLDLRLELDDGVACLIAGEVRAVAPMWLLLHNARLQTVSPGQAAARVIKAFVAGEFELENLRP